MRKILITNDDGIKADGIIRLAKAAAQFGQVWVLAPDSQRSAMSHSITLRTDIKAWPVDFPVDGVRAMATDGTPADCVRVGSLNFVPGRPDVILSGINYGYNMATDLQYSATAGAAFEGTFQGIPSFAFSEDASDCHEVTDRYLTDVLKEVLQMPYIPGKIVNVNFPGCPLSSYRGILRDRKVSRASFYTDHYEEEQCGDGVISYKVVGEYDGKCEEGTDFSAIVNHSISIGYASNIG